MRPNSKLARLEYYDSEDIVQFLDTGSSLVIPEEIQVFIKQIQWAAEVWSVERNTTRAAKKLRERILALQGEKLTIHQCMSRLFDSMNYFNVENNVAQDIWDRDTANKLEDLARLAIAQDKLDVAQRCYKQANEYRARANSSIDPDELQPPMFLVTPNLTPEDLGFKSEKLLGIAKKATDEVYARMISDLPLEKQEKLRLLNDAGIQDVDFEEIDDEHSDKG